MDNPSSRFKIVNFLLAWGGASLGFPFGGVVALSLAGPMDDAVSAALGGLLAGAVVGAAQWFVVRLYLGIDLTWIVATASGLALGNTLGAILAGFGEGIGDLLLIGAVAGAVVGAAQWSMLRERLRYAGLWVLALAVAWPLGWTSTWFIGADISLGYPVFGADGALVFAAVSGAVLLAMIRKLSLTPTAVAQAKNPPPR
ncbi:MAG: hypothetical protein WA990_01290 [Rubrobacteraceae bacterium]